MVQCWENVSSVSWPNFRPNFRCYKDGKHSDRLLNICRILWEIPNLTLVALRVFFKLLEETGHSPNSTVSQKTSQGWHSSVVNVTLIRMRGIDARTHYRFYIEEKEQKRKITVPIVYSVQSIVDLVQAHQSVEV